MFMLIYLAELLKSYYVSTLVTNTEIKNVYNFDDFY